MQGLSALLHFIRYMASFFDVDHLMKSHALNYRWPESRGENGYNLAVARLKDF